jgi:hypothetical protein
VVIDREGNIAGTQRGADGEPALRRLLARAGIGAEEDAALRRTSLTPARGPAGLDHE